MKYSLNLEKHLQNVIGKNVYSSETIIIGRVIEYDIETGITTVETDSKLTQGHNIGISSRKKI